MPRGRFDHIPHVIYLLVLIALDGHVEQEAVS